MKTEQNKKDIMVPVTDQYLQENDALFIRFWTFKKLEGALLSVIDGIGLPEKQEQVIKSYVTREVWTAIHDTYLISEEETRNLEQIFIGSSNA